MNENTINDDLEFYSNEMNLYSEKVRGMRSSNVLYFGLMSKYTEAAINYSSLANKQAKMLQLQVKAYALKPCTSKDEHLGYFADKAEGYNDESGCELVHLCYTAIMGLIEAQLN